MLVLEWVKIPIERQMNCWWTSTKIDEKLRLNARIFYCIRFLFHILIFWSHATALTSHDHWGLIKVKTKTFWHAIEFLYFKWFEVIELAMMDVNPTFFINKNELLWAICSPFINWDIDLLFIPNNGDHYRDQIPFFDFVKGHVGKFGACECFFGFF